MFKLLLLAALEKAGFTAKSCKFQQFLNNAPDATQRRPSPCSVIVCALAWQSEFGAETADLQRPAIDGNHRPILIPETSSDWLADRSEASRCQG